MRRYSTVLILSLLTLFSMCAFEVRVGESAPDFAATDSNGRVQKLSDYKGKYVVLEWTNKGCPFTRKHYDSGNMQKLQKEWTQKGVVWFTVVSSAPGSQGYVTAAEENDYVKQMNAAPTAVLLSPKGDFGHLFATKNTTRTFIIYPHRTTTYYGAVYTK